MGNTSGARIALGCSVGVVVSIVICRFATAALMGGDAIPVGGIVGAFIGAIGAVTAAKKKVSAVAKPQTPVPPQ